MKHESSWRWKVIIAFAAVYIIWGSTYLAIRVGVQQLPPALFAGSRFVVAGLLLALYARLSGQKFPTHLREWRTIAITALFMLVGANGLVVWGEQWVPSNQAALIVATTASKLGLPEVKRGLVAVGGALFRLPKRIPYHVVMELALTGEAQPAERFERLGLVSKLVAPGEALAAALQLAEAIAQNAPLSTAATKQILVKSAEWTEEQAWKAQRELARPALRSKDAAEGALAFAEKRAAVFRGE